MDALLDNRSLKFDEGAADLEYQLAHRRRRVDRLLVDKQIAPDRLEMLDRAEQVDQGPAEPVDSPHQQDVEVPPGGVVEHLVEARTIGSALSAGYPSVVVNLDHLPSAALCDLT